MLRMDCKAAKAQHTQRKERETRKSGGLLFTFSKWHIYIDTIQPHNIIPLAPFLNSHIETTISRSFTKERQKTQQDGKRNKRTK